MPIQIYSPKFQEGFNDITIGGNQGCGESRDLKFSSLALLIPNRLTLNRHSRLHLVSDSPLGAETIPDGVVCHIVYQDGIL
jgi:hypothetical protein